MILVYIPGLTLYNSVSVSFVVRAVTCKLLTVETSSDKAVNSWKCVANKQKALIFVAINLENNIIVRVIFQLYHGEKKLHYNILKNFIVNYLTIMAYIS